MTNQKRVSPTTSVQRHRLNVNYQNKSRRGDQHASRRPDKEKQSKEHRVMNLLRLFSKSLQVIAISLIIGDA
jgi:hypothetical protein